MFQFIFFLLMGLVSPSNSDTPVKHDCTTVTPSVDTPIDGPGGETGNNPPR